MRIACLSKLGFKSLSQLKADGHKHIYLYGRSSHDGQDIKTTMLAAKRYAESEGFTVAHKFADRGITGKTTKGRHRPALYRALDKGRDNGIPLVFVAPSRIIRARAWNRRLNRAAKPTEAEVERFLMKANGVTLGILNDPDSNPTEDEKFIRDIKDQFVRLQPPGRPPKNPNKLTRKERKALVLPVLVKLRERHGDSKGWPWMEGRIYREMGIRVSHRWLQKWYEEWQESVRESPSRGV